MRDLPLASVVVTPCPQNTLTRDTESHHMVFRIPCGKLRSVWRVEMVAVLKRAKGLPDAPLVQREHGLSAGELLLREDVELQGPAVFIFAEGRIRHERERRWRAIALS